MRFNIVAGLFIMATLVGVLWGGFALPESMTGADKWQAGYISGFAIAMAMQVIAALGRGDRDR